MNIKATEGFETAKNVGLCVLYWNRYPLIWFFFFFFSYINMFCSFIRMLFEGQNQYLRCQPRIGAQLRPPRNSIGWQSNIGQRIATFTFHLRLSFQYHDFSCCILVLWPHCVYDRACLRLILKYKIETTLLSRPLLLCCLLAREFWQDCDNVMTHVSG